MGRTIRTATALCGALALTLAACGGNDDSADRADSLGDLLDELGVSVPEDLLDQGGLGDLDLEALGGGEADQSDLGDLFDEEALDQLIEEGSGGAVDVDVGDDGLVVESEDGSFSIDDDGEFTVTDRDGEETTGRVDLDEDGGLTIEGDGGDVQFEAGTEIPTAWPADVPRPEGIEVETGFTVDESETFSVVVQGTIPQSAAEWAGTYRSQLVDAGFEEVDSFGEGDDLTSTLEDGTWRIALMTTSLAGETRASVTITELS